MTQLVARLDLRDRMPSELITGERQTLYVAVQPAGTNRFPSMANLETDYIEVRVRYRLP